MELSAVNQPPCNRIPNIPILLLDSPGFRYPVATLTGHRRLHGNRFFNHEGKDLLAEAAVIQNGTMRTCSMLRESIQASISIMTPNALSVVFMDYF